MKLPELSSMINVVWHWYGEVFTAIYLKLFSNYEFIKKSQYFGVCINMRLCASANNPVVNLETEMKEIQYCCNRRVKVKEEIEY
jgi:hypothetical protein